MQAMEFTVAPGIVIRAQAGSASQQLEASVSHVDFDVFSRRSKWIPACAGMTDRLVSCPDDKRLSRRFEHLPSSPRKRGSMDVQLVIHHVHG